MTDSTMFREPGRAPETDRSVADARAFRQILEAMARPGRPVALRPEGPEPTDALAPLSPAAAAVLLTLADVDAPYWLAPSRAAGEIERALRFATGTGPAEAPEQAAYCVGPWAELAELAAPRAKIGEPEYPDCSTTLIVEVESFEAAPTTRLTGPGVNGALTLGIAGVDAAFWRLLERNRLTFPLGLDLFLACGERLIGLPRSTVVEAL